MCICECVLTIALDNGRSSEKHSCQSPGYMNAYQLFMRNHPVTAVTGLGQECCSLDLPLSMAIVQGLSTHSQIHSLTPVQILKFVQRVENLAKSET